MQLSKFLMNSKNWLKHTQLKLILPENKSGFLQCLCFIILMTTRISKERVSFII